MRPHCFPFLVPSKNWDGCIRDPKHDPKIRASKSQVGNMVCPAVGKSSGSHLDVPIVRIQVPPRSNWTCPGVRSGRCLCRGVEGYRKPSMTIITSGINYSNNP